MKTKYIFLLSLLFLFAFSIDSTSQVNNPYVPNSVTIDKQKLVGEIPISSSISPTGAVIYTVPIEAYPGINDLQPQLALVYNHMAGNGIMGVGWNISGLSSISRGNQSFYYDKKTDGIKMTIDDAFYLDGMRLIKLSATTTEIQYESEQGNCRATAYITGNVVKYFKVFYPNGKTAVYGDTSNNSNYLAYPMTSLSDKFTNTITYQYTYSNNKYKINKITYGGATIEFSYTSRPNLISIFQGGQKIQESQLLQKITCKFNLGILRTYSFTYQSQKNNSILKQIDCSGSTSSASLNPLQFYYGENNIATTYGSSSIRIQRYHPNMAPKQLRTITGKFDYGTDNDGVIIMPAYPPYLQNSKNNYSQNKFDNLYDQELTNGIFIYTGLHGTGSAIFNYNSTFRIPIDFGFVDLFCADLDNQPGDEIIKINNTLFLNQSQTQYSDRIDFNVYSKNSQNKIELKYTRLYGFTTVLQDSKGNRSIHPKFYFPGDFNGDGKTEIFAISCDKPSGFPNAKSECYLFDLESNAIPYRTTGISFYKEFLKSKTDDGIDAENNSDKIYIIDYDGDGKSEICHINSTGTHIYKFKVSGSTYSGLELVASYSGLKKTDIKDRTLLLGELNGDGLPDFLLSPPTTNTSDYYWTIFYAKGDGQFEKKTNVKSANNGKEIVFCMQDVNGDGLSDLIKIEDNKFLTYIAENNIISSSSDGGTHVSIPDKSKVFPVEINNASNGQSFHLFALSDFEIKKYTYPRNDTKEKLLTGVVNSLGVVEKRSYETLNRLSTYTKGTGAVFPYSNFSGSLFVPRYAEQYLCGIRKEYLTYSFSNAVIHRQGLGFRGFGSIKTYDNIRSRSTTLTYEPYNFSVLKKEESHSSTISYEHSIDISANKIAKIRMTRASLNDKLKNIIVTRSFTYDTYGNPTTERTDYGNDVTVFFTRTFYNNTNLSNYLIGFLTDEIKTTVDRYNSSWFERVHIASHNNKGKPLTRNVYASNSTENKVSEEIFVYESNGNLKQKKVKPYTSTYFLSLTLFFV